MKRFFATFAGSVLAGVVFAVTFCACAALVFGGAAWWLMRSAGLEDGAAFIRRLAAGLDDARTNNVVRVELSGEIEPEETDDDFEEIFVSGVDDAKAAKVVRVKISGEIGSPSPSLVDDLLGGAMGSGGSSGSGNFDAVRERIHLATDDKDVKGLYLVIDTPGGDLTDSDLLWHDVQLFRAAQPGRFVFVHGLAQCCSGGYYVASAADFIMVLPTSEVGAIGIISDYGYNVSDLARRFGVSSVVVSTGEHKDAFNPLKPVDPRQIAIEQGLIDSQFARFVQVVSKGRDIPVEKVRELADGRAFAAKDAVEKGLADAVGYEEDVMAKLREFAGGDVRVVAYSAPPEPETSFLSKLIFGGKLNVQHVPSARRRRGLPVPRLRLVR